MSVDSSASAIRALIHAYARRIDEGDFEALGELLAQAVVRADGRTVAECDARAVSRLYETTTRRYDDGTPKTKHLVTNLDIDVDEEAGTARAESCFAVLQALSDFPLQTVIAGRYRDRFERSADGWRFAEREIFTDLHGDLSRHLLVRLP